MQFACSGGDDIPVFKTYVVAPKTPSVVRGVESVLKGQDAPDEWIVNSEKGRVNKSSSLPETRRSYTLT